MSAHFCAAIPNFRVMEIDIDDVPWKDDLVTVGAGDRGRAPRRPDRARMGNGAERRRESAPILRGARTNPHPALPRPASKRNPMLIATSITQANERRQIVDVHGQEYLLREFVGAVPRRGTYVDGNEANDNGLPQGFLVSQPPGSVTPPHFHETNQFQVFVGGSGRLGKRRADPVTVQFAGGHTPYGPIAAEDRGIQYFTLRPGLGPGGEVHARDAGPPRAGAAAPAPRAAGGAAGRGGARRARGAGGRDPHRPRGGRDGGGARAARPRHAHLTLLRWRRAVPGGRRGDPRARGEELPRLSCRFATADESQCEFRAGPAGAAVLALQFPALEGAGTR